MVKKWLFTDKNIESVLRDKAHAFGSWRLSPRSYPCYIQNGIQGTSRQIQQLYDANTKDISTKKMMIINMLT